MLAAAAVVCWTVIGFALQYFRTYTLAREATRLERRRQDLLAQNVSLRAEIQRLHTDDQYLERLARGQLGMLRPGEMELVIVPVEPIRQPTERDHAKTEIAEPKGLGPSLGRAVRDTTQALRAAFKRLRDTLLTGGP